MIRVSRVHLKLLSIAIGLLFVGLIYQTMTKNPRWDRTAPGAGKMPRVIVSEFMEIAYAKGQGGSRGKDYFAADAKDNASTAGDRQDGVPIAHEIRSVVAQGLNVVVIHRIAPARGEPQSDVVDHFQIKNGRIARRDRYPTRFAN